MELFCILTVVLNTQIYTCDRIAQNWIHTHTYASKYKLNWGNLNKSIDCTDIYILLEIYYSSVCFFSIGENCIKFTGNLSILLLTTRSESTIILKWKVQLHNNNNNLNFIRFNCHQFPQILIGNWENGSWSLALWIWQNVSILLVISVNNEKYNNHARSRAFNFLLKKDKKTRFRNSSYSLQRVLSLIFQSYLILY